MATTKVSTKLLETVGVAEGGTGATSAGAARTSLGLGTVATLNTGTANGNVPLLDSTGLPAVDGSQLTGISTGATNAEAANIMLNAFRISVNGGLTAQNMVDGVVDEFEDQTGIEDDDTTGEIYDATGDSYGNVAAGSTEESNSSYANGWTNFVGVDRVPQVDSSTTVTHLGIKCNAVRTGSLYIALENSTTSYTIKAEVTYSHTGGSTFEYFALATPFVVPGSGTYRVMVYMSGTSSGEVCTASQAVSYQSGVTPAPTGIDTTVTGFTAGSQQVRSAGVQYSGATSDLSLLSEPTTALAVPTDTFIVAWEEDVDSVTLNTDLLAWVTREAGQTFTTDFGTDEKLDITGHGFLNDDRVMVTSSSQDLPAGSDSATVYYVVNKTTNDFELSLTSGGSAINITDNGTGTHTARRWVQATLTKEAALTTGQILTGTADVSGLTSGTTMRYALVNANTKGLKVHAVALQWS